MNLHAAQLGIAATGFQQTKSNMYPVDSPIVTPELDRLIGRLECLRLTLGESLVGLAGAADRVFGPCPQSGETGSGAKPFSAIERLEEKIGELCVLANRISEEANRFAKLA